MLETVVELLNRPHLPFAVYYQEYICRLQDDSIDFEISSYSNQIQLHSEIYQLKKLQKLISTL